MASPPVLSLRDGQVTFGGRPVFAGVDLAVSAGDRACLVGRNGCGKSTLLKVLAGRLELDGGQRYAQPGLRIGHLDQDPRLDTDAIAGHVAAGLPPGQEDQRHRVYAMLAALGLDGGKATATLSGGEARRAALARALIGEPEVLLLDEPTNHLDLPTILWLEERLQAFPGAVVLVSHDRAFLSAVSNGTLWLDRGRVLSRNRGFSDFERWSEEVTAAEEAESARLDKKLEAETHWLHRGVTARRRRNIGRLRKLMALRVERAERLTPVGQARLAASAGQASGRLVIEAQSIGKAFRTPDGQSHQVIADFSTRILRGDRVGIIGPNGSGKTTLLRLLTGDLSPDSGMVRLGTNLTPAYLDQRRHRLDPEETVWRTLTGGSGDQVMVRGQSRHVIGYLRDFLFEDRQAHSPVKALSGGERNRLLLAKLLAGHSNLLILDEPTNDLDMDTLDLLEEVLADYDGTLLLVSHDRAFLDRLATSVIVLEGDGRAGEYVGGYSDYLRQRPSAEPPAAAKARPAAPAKPKQERRRLSYNEQRDLDRLPRRIEALHTEIAALEARISDAGFYAEDPQGFARAAERLEAARGELADSEERWLELEVKREEIAAGP